jgi:hypothetical protein
MAKRLSPEEKAQRELERKAERLAELRAKAEAQAQAWRDENARRKAEFQANLTEEERESLAFLQPIREEQHPYAPEGTMRKVYKTELIGNLASQFESRGYLSPNQLAVLVRQLRKEKETKALVAQWNAHEVISVGMPVEIFGKVARVEKRLGDHGYFWKIRVVNHYGREYQFNTASKTILERATALLESQEPVCIDAKVKWISDDGRYCVLTSRGMKFGGLLE